MKTKLVSFHAYGNCKHTRGAMIFSIEEYSTVWQENGLRTRFDAAIHKAVEIAGGKSEDEAKAYVEALKKRSAICAMFIRAKLAS